MGEQLIGTVIHYFKQPGVAVVGITDGEVALDDEIHFVGHTTDFTEKVTSMEVNHQRVERATVGEEIAIKVVARARRHDRVFKVVPEE